MNILLKRQGRCLFNKTSYVNVITETPNVVVLVFNCNFPTEFKACLNSRISVNTELLRTPVQCKRLCSISLPDPFQNMCVEERR
jgi:hypothetical protein